jgi:N-acetylglucosamine malate deacetylase 1
MWMPACRERPIGIEQQSIEIMNVLVVVAHPDDEIFGCGATTRKLADEGHHVFSVVLCGEAEARYQRPELHELQTIAENARQMVGIHETINYSFKNIEFNTVPHLEMVRAIEAAIVKFSPEWVFTHHPGDLNIDHRVCFETTAAAITLPQRLSSSLSPTHIKRVATFEVPSSTDWAPPLAQAFRPNSFVDVSATLDRKIEALESFRGALKPHPHSRSRENVRNIAAVRGAQINVEFAEAFCIIRDVN